MAPSGRAELGSDPLQAGGVSRPSPRTPVLSLFLAAEPRGGSGCHVAGQTPVCTINIYSKVFLVVSVINGPLTKSMDQVSQLIYRRPS